MTHWDKFERAHKHLHDINDVIARFLDMKPYRLIGEYEPKHPFPMDGYVRFTLRMHAPLLPPDELPTLIGDCLYNLRGSLDHLVYGIALQHTRRDELADQKALQFAIYEEDGQFSAWRGRVAALLPAAVIAQLEEFQPYKGFPGPPITEERHFARNPLWVLNTLTNADKHRALMPVTNLRVSGVRIQSDMPGEGQGIASTTLSGTFKHGEVIIPYNFLPVSPDSEVTINPDFTPDVAFSEVWPAMGRGVRGTLEVLRDFIREQVFPVFEPFL